MRRRRVGERHVIRWATVLLATFSAACGPSNAPVVPEVVVVPVPADAPPAPSATAEAQADRALPPGLDGLLPLMWLALKRGPAVPQLELTFRKTTLTELIRLVRRGLPKSYALKDSTGELSFDYVTVEYGKHFLIFKFGNEDDEYKGKLFNAAFTAYYPKRRVPERQTDVYKAIVAARGPSTSVAKFRYSTDSAADDLDLHVWDDPEVVITYRAYHDEDDDQDIVVVNFAEADFFHSHHYWDY